MVSNVAPATVALLGSGLSAIPTVDLDEDDPPAVDDQFRVEIGNTELEATLVESDRVQVILEEGFPAGTYDVSLTTPSGITSTLAQALRVTEDNVRGCLDVSDCIDPCHSVGDCVNNVCVLDPPDNPLCSFDTPAMIAELSEPNANDRTPTVTGDLLELYFQSDRDAGTDTDIWMSTRATVGDPWSPPTRVAELSTNNRDDGAPEITQDGLTIYLSSDRDRNNQLDIYISTRADRSMPWSPPTLVEELSTNQRDEHATPDSSNLRMVTRAGDLFDGDLLLTGRASVGDPWNEPVPIAELNTSGSDSSGFLEADGLIMIIASDRTGGIGANDIWITSRQTLSRPFVVPELSASLSSDSEDLDPWTSADGSYTVFASDRDGNFNLYEAH